MLRVGVFYVDDYAESEEAVFRTCGVRVWRGQGLFDVPVDLALRACNLAGGGVVVAVRTRRIGLSEYTVVHDTLQRLGMRPCSSPDSFRLASSFSLQYPLVARWSPRAAVFSADVTAETLLSILVREKFRFPVFVRGDVESAAKYVGVARCTILDPSLAASERVLRELRAHVRPIEEIVVKEVVPIAEGAGGGKLEYRCVGVQGELVAFDRSADTTSDPAPASLGLDETARAVLASLFSGGLTGAVFLDLAVTTHGSHVVVECKDFSHGTIRHPEVIGRALAAAKGSGWGG